MSATATKSVVASLYRRSLKLSLNWCVRRDIWRSQALNIRELFEENRDVTDPRQLRVILEQTEATLERWKHPDPYCPPTAPGGSKYERNMPCPILDPPIKMDHLQSVHVADTPQSTKVAQYAVIFPRALRETPQRFTQPCEPATLCFHLVKKSI